MSIMRKVMLMLALYGAALTAGLAAEETEAAEAAEAVAETQADGDYADAGEDGGITLTGTRKLEPVVPEVSAFGQRNTVDAAQIEAQGSKDLLDALRNVPGVSFSKRNMIGGDTGTSLYIRGRGASHPSVETVTNFDGVPRNGAIYGQSMPDSFALSMAERIDVYKSPQPSAFGAGYALVDMIPRYQDEQGWQAEAGLSLGSFLTAAESAAAGIRAGRFDIFAAQGWASTEGHTEHSSAHQQSYYLNGGLWINPAWNIRVLANYVNALSERPRSETDSPSTVLPSFKTDSFLSTLTLNNAFDKAEGSAKLYFSGTNFYWLDENPGALPNAPKDYYSLQVLSMAGIRVKETLTLWDGGEIIAGADTDFSRTRNLDDNDDGPAVLSSFPDMFLFSPYLAASHTFNFGKYGQFYLVPQAGLRGYVHTVWANTLTPQVGILAGWKDTSVYANYSLGCVYPAPANIQSLVNSGKASDADLKSVNPEVVYHWELGLTQSAGELATLGASFFYDDGRNRIIALGSVPENASLVSYFRISGVELYGSVKPISGLSLFAGGTWMTVAARGEDGNVVTVMPFTPGISVSAGLSWELSSLPVRLLRDLSLSADYRFLGGVYANTNLQFSAGFINSENTSKLDDQHLLHIRLCWSPSVPAFSSWRINRAELFCDLENALNQRYEYWPGYRMPGLTVSAGFKASFK